MKKFVFTVFAIILSIITINAQERINGKKYSFLPDSSLKAENIIEWEYFDFKETWISKKNEINSLQIKSFEYNGDIYYVLEIEYPTQEFEDIKDELGRTYSELDKIEKDKKANDFEKEIAKKGKEEIIEHSLSKYYFLLDKEMYNAIINPTESTSKYSAYGFHQYSYEDDEDYIIRWLTHLMEKKYIKTSFRVKRYKDVVRFYFDGVDFKQGRGLKKYADEKTFDERFEHNYFEVTINEWSKLKISE